MMRLVILGASPACQNAGGACSGYLLEQNGTYLLIDCGPGVLSRLQQHVAPERIAAVVITHMHADHTLDLIQYRYYLFFAAEARRETPRPALHLPPGGHQRLLMISGVQDPSASFFDAHFAVQEYEPAAALQVGPFALTFAPVRHVPHTYAVRVRGDAIFSFSADSGPCPELAQVARSSDLFLCECANDERSTYPYHLTPRQAGAVATEAGARQLLLTHRLWSLGAESAVVEARQTFEGPVSLAREGMQMQIERVTGTLQSIWTGEAVMIGTARLEGCSTVGAGSDPSGMLDELCERIAPAIKRPEVRARVRRYLDGLIRAPGRTSGGQRAEATGEDAAQGMQRLLSSAQFDADAARDALRAYVIERLDLRKATLAVVEVSFPKRGVSAAGTARQYAAGTGRVENCQVGLLLALVTPAATVFIDRRLYLPERWTINRHLRMQARVPETVHFARLDVLAATLLEDAIAAGATPAWVAGPDRFGASGPPASTLGAWSEERQLPTMLYLRQQPWHRAEGLGATLADAIPEYAWRVGLDGSHWACVPLGAAGNGMARWWLVERHETMPAHFRAYGKAGTAPADLIWGASAQRRAMAAVARAWTTVGLHRYEVRCWDGWHRHITLALLAFACLELHAASADGAVHGAQDATTCHPKAMTVS